MSNFITYQIIKIPELSSHLFSVLKENGIPYILEDTSPTVDLTFSGGHANKEARLKIRQQDFEKLDKLLEEIALNDIEQTPSDHYLYDFTDKELMEILEKPDEWNKEDYILAKQLLKQRGHIISNEALVIQKNKRIGDLANPRKVSTGQIIGSYLLSFFLGIVGIGIGLHYMYSKITLPDGTQVDSYEPNAKKHGKYYFIIGVIGVIFNYYFLFFRKL